MVVGIWWRGEQIRSRSERNRADQLQELEQSLLEELRRRPLFRTTATGYVAASIDAVNKFLAPARESKVDLLEVYRRASDQPDTVRVSLAYMLAVDRPEEYLSLAESREQVADPEEVVLWIHLMSLTGSDSRLSPEFPDRLPPLIMQSGTPPGRWYASRRYQQAGADDSARQLWLELLKSKGYYGAQAARRLAETDEHRDRAMAYLRKLADSDDPDKAREGLLGLAEAHGGRDWPEYRAFRVLDSPENALALRTRLDYEPSRPPVDDPNGAGVQ